MSDDGTRRCRVSGSKPATRRHARSAMPLLGNSSFASGAWTSTKSRSTLVVVGVELTFDAMRGRATLPQPFHGQHGAASPLRAPRSAERAGACVVLAARDCWNGCLTSAASPAPTQRSSLMPRSRQARSPAPAGLRPFSGANRMSHRTWDRADALSPRPRESRVPLEDRLARRLAGC